jgi:cytochrome c biogenesis protein CcmG/thiol:disulfide interchange protein DsbE
VVVNFWASYCVPCLAEHPVLTGAARSLRDEVHFLGVVYEDEPEPIRDFLRRKGSSYPTLLDDHGQTAIAYGVYGVPETFVIDPNGTITAKHVGAMTQPLLDRYLQEAVEGTRTGS